MSHIQSLRDHVCSYIHQQILQGELKAHEKLNESKICEDLNISRTPAREALIMLATDHIIDFIPRKGFFVREVTVDYTLQYYSLMGHLDSFSAGLAIDNLTEDDFSIMEEIIAKIDLAIKFNRFDEYVELQEKFHDIYLNRCNNMPLIETITSLRYRYIPITYNVEKVSNETFKEILYKTNNEHQEIIKLFKSKEKEKLESFIKNVHWDTTYIGYL